MHEVIVCIYTINQPTIVHQTDKKKLPKQIYWGLWVVSIVLSRSKNSILYLPTIEVSCGKLNIYLFLNEAEFSYANFGPAAKNGTHTIRGIVGIPQNADTKQNRTTPNQEIEKCIALHVKETKSWKIQIGIRHDRNKWDVRLTWTFILI